MLLPLSSISNNKNKKLRYTKASERPVSTQVSTKSDLTAQKYQKRFPAGPHNRPTPACHGDEAA
jgi:maltose-binding protein MalE